MALHRAHIVLPYKLIAGIDSIVGPRGRSAFLVKTARAELRRRRLLTYLQDTEPTWNDENHPGLANGTEAWVRDLREEGEDRLRKIEERKRLILLLDMTVL